MKYEIIPISKLLPLEKVFPTHLRNLEDMINRDGYILKALIVDKKRGIILDGSHRYVYFLKNGFREVPVHLVDYDSEDIRVGTRLKHRFFINDDLGISKLECINRAESGDLFPPRTTRHFFTFRKVDISLPLKQLKRGKRVDVSHLIDDVDISYEIAEDEKYISEINEEIEIIINYLSEVSETKKYLSGQTTLMKDSMQIAFFPGKFHPPHLGHIQTIYKVLGKYRKLIICVSGHVPNDPVTTPRKIYDVLTDFFKDTDCIEVTFLDETLIEKSDLSGLPKFDVLLSGNEDVLNWARKMNIRSEFVSRSENYFCSGTELRSILSKEDEDEL